MRHGRADTQFLLRRSDIVVWARDRRRERRLPPCPLSRVRRGSRRAISCMELRALFSRRSACDRNFPLQHPLRRFFQGVGHRDLVPSAWAPVQREVAELDRLPARIEVRHPLGAVAKRGMTSVPLHGRGEGLQPAAQGSKAPSSACAATASCGWRCDEAAVRARGQGFVRSAAQMLRNSLRAAFGDFGGAEHPFFSQRVEQLSVADFVALTQWWSNGSGRLPPRPAG